MSRGYIVHKAVEVSKVHAKRRAVLEQEGYLDREYVAQHKYDGVSAVIVLDVGEAPKVLSRTGEVCTSLDYQALELARIYAEQTVEHNGLVILAEAWHPEIPFAEISGLFRRHAPSPELQLMVFDAIPLEDFRRGRCDIEFLSRQAICLEPFMPGGINPAGKVHLARSYMTPGTAGRKTWQDLCNYVTTEKTGYDGLILRDPHGTWTKGSGTSGEIIKLKRKLSFDLRVTGIEEGKGKHAGRMGALILDFNGKALRVGTGFSDLERTSWWTRPEDIKGQIVEIEAMDLSSDGLLREPRFKGVRFDKVKADGE